MKRPLVLILTIVFKVLPLQSVLAQERTHQGLYLSMGLGSVSGSIYGSDNSGNKLLIDGPAFGFDAQIGGPVAKDLLLHGTISVKTIAGPTINSIKVPDNYSFNEGLLGMGLTKYLQHNFFLTGNVGLGNYSLSETSKNSSSGTITSDRGFSYQVKAGKEWWVTSKWALGLAFTYSNTSINSQSGSVSEHWNSSRYGIMLTGTFFRNH
jgi:opacity protein-like surface antigen